MVIINTPKNGLKTLLNLAKTIYNNKYVRIVLTIIEWVIALVSIGLIMDGQAKGYIGLLIIIGINLYSIWKMRKFLKNFWAYIYHMMSKAGAKAKRERLKQQQEENGNKR